MLSDKDSPTTCTIDGEPQLNQNYPGSYNYPVKVNGQQLNFLASKTTHDKLVKIGAKFGTTFQVQKVLLDGGKSYNKIIDTTGTEVTVDRKYSGGGAKRSYANSPEENASIMAQWAIGKAVDALVIYKQEGNQVPNDNESRGRMIIAIAKNFYSYKRELQKHILDDLNNTGKEGNTQ